MAYFYKDQNFQGPYLHMETGTVYGKYMLGCPARSTYCDEIAGEIKSVRIEQNTIAMISDSVSLYNGHSQVLIGPMSISHNTFNIQSILVTRYKDYDFVTPAPGPLVTLCNNLSMVGMQYHLYMGDYSYHRLMSEEIKIDPKNILSMQIAPNVILIVEADNKTILLRGPKTINDLQEVGLSNSVIHSLKVKYSPPDTNVVDRAYDKIMSWIKPTSSAPTIISVESPPPPPPQQCDTSSKFHAIILFLILIIIIIVVVLIFLRNRIQVRDSSVY